MTGLWDNLGELAGTQFVDDRAKAMVDRGLRCQDERQYDDAIANFQAAIEIEREYVDPHQFLANTYGQLGRFDESFREYRVALTLAQKHLPKPVRKDGIVQIMYNLSLTIAARQNREEGYRNAAGDFRSTCRGLKLPPTYHVALANILVGMGLNDEAIREYERFLAKDGGSELAETIRTAAADLRALEISKGGADSAGRSNRGKRKWWQFWRSKRPMVGSRDEPGSGASDQERHAKSFEGKTKKCINCDARLSASELACSVCGSDRFIWA